MKKILLLAAAIIACSTTFANIKNEKIVADRNGFLYQDSPSATLGEKTTLNNMDLKNHSGYSRYGYVEFPINKISESATKIYFRIYLPGADLGYTEDFKGKNVEVSLFGGDYRLNEKWTWTTQPIIANPTNPGETALGTLSLTNDNKGTFLEWDVTEFVKARKQEGAKNVCFRLSAGNQPLTVLLKLRQLFIKDGMVQNSKYNPYLFQQ